MYRIALMMLFSDRAKFLGLVFTLSFSAFLITQQICVFTSIMRRTTSQINDVHDANIWVADKNTHYIDEIWPLADTDVYRVRSAVGVEWAVPFFKSLAIIKSPKGIFRSCLVLGLDDASLVGAPVNMILGEKESLDRPNAILMDKAGYHFFFPEEDYQLGKTFELNDHRAILTGICEASAPFQTVPVVYAKYSDAIQFTGAQRRKLSFILAHTKPGYSIEEVCKNINERSGLCAFSSNTFAWKTILYYLQNTGIAINFGLTISIAILVGMVVSGQTFYLFTLENLKQFATLKAIGVSHAQMIGMVLLQATSVGILGYCFGMGLAGLFFKRMAGIEATRGLILEWQGMLLSGCTILLIVVITSLISLKRVLTLEPASVFRS